MKLQSKFLIPVILVLILSFTIISVVSVSFARRTAGDILESQMISAVETVEHQISAADEIVSIVLNMMDQKEIALAQALANMIAEDEGNLAYEKMESLARQLGVDEVHVTDENGVLLWGNMPDFYGFAFDTDQQTQPLLAILDDPALTIAQEPQPRGVDGVMFQYISVSRIDKPGIVQVGVSMERIEDIRESMSVQNTIQGMEIGHDGGVFLLDADKKIIADSSHDLLGRDMSGQPWADAMYAGREGHMSFLIDDIEYDAYYRLSGDVLIVTYVPMAQINAYMTSALTNILPVGAAATLIVVCIIIMLIRWIVEKIYWYESILDSIPFPITITDMDRKWTFINKAVEDFLGKKRAEVMGLSCSHWGAHICDTDQCGITRLYAGESKTFFHQNDMDFEVIVSFAVDRKGRKVGHIEFVREITEMVKSQQLQEGLVKTIAEVSESFVSASKRIAGSSQALAQGSTQQSDTVEQLSSSISEIAQKTKNDASMAERAAELAGSIMRNAEKGNQQMEEMMSAVKEINQASQDISRVIKVIDDIAFQTNILALNAAVEAARAGQHGKGFAVVAEEVRNLAAKSAEAAKDTSRLIANSMEKAEFGARIATETAASLEEIVSGINESNQIVREIAKSSEEQSHGIEQINDGISRVAQVVTQTTATAEESAAASVEMSTQSEALEKLITQFQLRDEEKAAIEKVV